MIDEKYLAGFIDGDGCITVQRNKQTKHLYSYQLRVSIGNTNKNVLNLIQNQYGGEFCKAQAVKKKKVFYNLEWYGINAQGLLEKVKDHLVIKKVNAELGLLFPAGFGTGNRVFLMEREIQEKLYQEFRKLNK